MTKKILIPILIVAAIGAGYLLKQSKPAILEFKSTIMPVSFQYPEGYIVMEKDDTITVMKEADYLSILNGERAGGEGPATISIRVVDNPNNPSPRVWAEQYPPQSNYGQRTSEVSEFTLSGFPAISYEADGLYQNRNVIIGTDYRLYYIFGSYTDKDSDLYRDFEPLLNSIVIK